MKSIKILIFILTSITLLFISACKKTNYCQTYNQDLNLLRARGQNVAKLLDMKLSSGPEKAKAFDSKWFYLDLEHFVLPLPNRPRTIEKKENDDDMTINANNYVVVVTNENLNNLLDYMVGYLKNNNIQSTYDFNDFLFSDRLFQCEEIKSKKDLMAKTIFAKAKSVQSPFNVTEAFKVSESETIAVYGTQQSKNQYVTYLYIKNEAQNAYTVMAYFQNQDDQSKFHSYLAKVHDKDFFKKGKKLNF